MPDRLNNKKKSAHHEDQYGSLTEFIFKPDVNKSLLLASQARIAPAVWQTVLFALITAFIYSFSASPALLSHAGNLPGGILTLIALIFGSVWGINGLLFIIFRILGGTGNFTRHSFFFARLIVVFGSLLVITQGLHALLPPAHGKTFNPFTLSGLIGALQILICLHGLILTAFSMRVIHQLKATQAVWALAILFAVAGIARVIQIFVRQEDHILLRVWTFIQQQTASGALQTALLGHIWLVLFAILLAVIIGIITGVLITMPGRRPKLADLLFTLPLVLFFSLWAASSGLLGDQIASQIADTTRTWDRSLRGTDTVFTQLVVIVGAILRKPEAIALTGIGLTLIFYMLTVFGERAAQLTLYITGIILTIPSIALFGVLIKPLGIGAFNAVFALVLYAQLPILRNTYTGIKEVAPEIVEAGRGMGMTEYQLLLQVKLPLSIPVIMTGLRVSTVMLVGIAAIAAYIGNATMGDYIFTGISRAQDIRYITGAIVVAILAVVVDYALGFLQEKLTPTGLKIRRKLA
jgi:osmoprotectant transport system permease protein